MKRKGETTKLVGVIRKLSLYNSDHLSTSLNFDELHWMICLSNISDKTFTKSDSYDPPYALVHKSSDMNKMENNS